MTRFSPTLFAPHRASIFTLQGPNDRSVDLLLVEVTDKTPANSQGVQFSLIFEGPDDPALEQRIYGLDHAGLGRLHLFLVPVGVRGASRLYEASFSLMS